MGLFPKFNCRAKFVITICMRFGMIVHVNVAYIQMAALSWADSILYLTVTFVKGFLQKWHLYRFSGRAISCWEVTQYILQTYMVTVSSTMVGYCRCQFSLNWTWNMFKTLILFLHEWHVAGRHVTSNSYPTMSNCLGPFISNYMWTYI